MFFIFPLITITDIIMFFPEYIPSKILKINGTILIDILHVIGGFIISIFLVIHLYFSTTGTKIGSHFRSIITGWHEIDKS